MFGYLTDTIENALDVLGGVVEGEAPTKRQVAKLIDAGFTIGGIAAVFGVGTEVIENLMED